MDKNQLEQNAEAKQQRQQEQEQLNKGLNQGEGFVLSNQHLVPFHLMERLALTINWRDDYYLLPESTPRDDATWLVPAGR